MCNYKHPDSQPIPESGTGWKIFGKNKKNEKVANRMLTDYLNIHNHYSFKDGTVLWSGYPGNCGFCFFLTREEARKAIKFWREYFPKKHYVLLKINYSLGICKHIERNFCDEIPITIALCKSFSLAKARENNGYTL